MGLWGWIQQTAPRSAGFGARRGEGVVEGSSTCDKGHSFAKELWFMSLSNSLRAFLTVEWVHCSGGKSSSLGQLQEEIGGERRGGKGGGQDQEIGR